jgi:hypothetical protein
MDFISASTLSHAEKGYVSVVNVIEMLMVKCLERMQET